MFCFSCGVAFPTIVSTFVTSPCVLVSVKYTATKEDSERFDGAFDAIQDKSQSFAQDTPVDPSKPKDPPNTPKDPPKPKERTEGEIAFAAAQKAHKAYDSFLAVATAIDANTTTNPYSIV